MTVRYGKSYLKSVTVNLFIYNTYVIIKKKIIIIIIILKTIGEKNGADDMQR